MVHAMDELYLYRKLLKAIRILSWKCKLNFWSEKNFACYHNYKFPGNIFQLWIFLTWIYWCGIWISSVCLLKTLWFFMSLMFNWFSTEMIQLYRLSSLTSLWLCLFLCASFLFCKNWIYLKFESKSLSPCFLTFVL